MNVLNDDNLLKSLKFLYDSDASARAVFDWFATRQNDAGTITVRRASQKSNIDDRSTFEVFRKLENLRCGHLIVGRRGHETRMKFEYGVRSLAAVAKGGDQKPIAVNSVQNEDDVKEDDGDQSSIKHQYKLRTGFEVVLSLPSDFNSREAERLANFIRTLPFED